MEMFVYYAVVVIGAATIARAVLRIVDAIDGKDE